MKPLALAVTVVVIAVLVGILSAPWTQVVEEHSRTKELAYATTYTYSRSCTYTSTYNYARTESSTVLEATNVHLLGRDRPDANRWTSNWFQLTEGKTIIVELGVTPWRSYHVYFDLWPAFEFQGMVCEFSLGSENDAIVHYDFYHHSLECTVPKTGYYQATLSNFEDYDLYADMKLMVQETIITETTRTTTHVSTEFRAVTLTSTITITWYNTTYKRPFG
jgi:hypothetical protein